MKVIFLTDFYPPFFFGGEKAVQREAEGLVSRGHQVAVITTSPNVRSYVEQLNGVKIYRFFPYNLYPLYQSPTKPMFIKPLYYLANLWNLQSYRKVKEILNIENPDVVHIHNLRGLSLSASGAVKNLKLPLVFTLNDYFLICPKGSLLRASGRICYRPLSSCQVYSGIHKRLFDAKPDIVTSTSHFMIDKLKTAGFFNNVNTIMMPVGVKMNDFKPKKDYLTINILYVGGINRAKGVHILIEAFKRLRQVNVKLDVVGKGHDMEEMKRLAANNPNIIFHGFVSDEELVRLGQKANISIVPSIWLDTAQGVIYESFSFGTPVVGSRISGIPELIDEGHNGLLFEAGNVEELTAILDKLINNPDELRRLENGAFESSKKYDIINHIQKLEILYQDIRNNVRHDSHIFVN